MSEEKEEQFRHREDEEEELEMVSPEEEEDEEENDEAKDAIEAAHANFKPSVNACLWLSAAMKGKDSREKQ